MNVLRNRGIGSTWAGAMLGVMVVLCVAPLAVAAPREEKPADAYPHRPRKPGFGVKDDDRRGRDIPRGRGAVVLDVAPRDVDVRINGVLRGHDGRETIYLPPGRYDIELSRDGYRRWSSEIRVREGDRTRIERSLSRDRDARIDNRERTARVELDIRPRDVQVRVNGVVTGKDGDGVVRLEEGSYLIEVSKRGYRTWTQRISVRAGERVRLAQRLERR